MLTMIIIKTVTIMMAIIIMVTITIMIMKNTGKSPGTVERITHHTMNVRGASCNDDAMNLYSF